MTGSQLALPLREAAGQLRLPLSLTERAARQALRDDPDGALRAAAGHPSSEWVRDEHGAWWLVTLPTEHNERSRTE